MLGGGHPLGAPHHPSSQPPPFQVFEAKTLAPTPHRTPNFRRHALHPMLHDNTAANRDRARLEEEGNTEQRGKGGEKE